MSPKLVFTLNMTILFSPSIGLNLFITWDNEVYVFKCILLRPSVTRQVQRKTTK